MNYFDVNEIINQFQNNSCMHELNSTALFDVALGVQELNCKSLNSFIVLNIFAYLTFIIRFVSFQNLQFNSFLKSACMKRLT